MEWFRKLWRGVDATDTAISWTERVLYILFGSSIPGIVSGGFLTLLAANLQVGLVAGLVVWLAVLMGLLYKAARDADKPTVARSESESVPSQPADTDSPPPTDTVSENAAPSKDVYEGESIDIALLARQLEHFEGDTGLRGLTFVRCIIYGPAILDPPENEKVFDDCRWKPGTIPLWLIHPKERPNYGGAIRLENCIFRRCVFWHVGLLTDPEKYQVLSGGGAT